MTPIVYRIYKFILYRNRGQMQAVVYIFAIGLIVSVIHVVTPFYSDISLRSWLGIIDNNFWTTILSELPLVIKYLNGSMVTFLLLLGLFSANDHFEFVKSYVVRKEPKSVEQWRVANRNPESIAGKLAVKSEGEIRFIRTTEIRCVESIGNYIRIQLNKERIIVRTTLKRILDELPQSKFYRLSRSFIVNKDFLH